MLNLVSQFGKLGLSPLCQRVTCLPHKIVGEQVRTTFVLKRRHPAPRHKKGNKPHKMRNKYFIYELVEHTDTKKKHEKMDVILTKYVEGVGVPGDTVSVKPNFAHKDLLLPKLAVYASPENVENISKAESLTEEKHSSRTAGITIKYLSKQVLSIVMNKDVAWTLEPWHVRMSFRKAGIFVPEEAITMPENPIKGPDLSLEGKEFYVTVTVNNVEQTPVRCRIHHWSTKLEDRLPLVYYHWAQPAEPVFAEQAEVLKSLPPLPPAPEREEATS